MIDALPCDRASLAACLSDARARTIAAISDLDDAALLPPRSAIVNPLLWEVGHVAWFQERWTLRHLASAPPIVATADALYDSAATEHEVRWSLPLLGRDATLAYARQALERALERLDVAEIDERELYFHRLALFHEDMHLEAFLLMRQTLGHPPPPRAVTSGADDAASPRTAAESTEGDVELEGGTVLVGARRDAPFAFDNEQWEHEVVLAPFAIARAPVTQAEYAAFVDDGGYARRELWTDEGWRWRERVDARAPLYWRRAAGGRWERRAWNRWVELEPRLPAHHVCAHEADAYCRWAHRRLPTEAEWEHAASERSQPWPDEARWQGRANLDVVHAAPIAVDALAGAAPWQMVGNVWEWTASDFLPYPGFESGPYREYSEPWFGDRRVLRGGSFATRARLLRRTWRNFYEPWRRDVFAGFRTAALRGSR